MSSGQFGNGLFTAWSAPNKSGLVECHKNGEFRDGLSLDIIGFIPNIIGYNWDIPVAISTLELVNLCIV